MPHAVTVIGFIEATRFYGDAQRGRFINLFFYFFILPGEAAGRACKRSHGAHQEQGDLGKDEARPQRVHAHGTCHSSLITHHSSLITHHLLLITYHVLATTLLNSLSNEARPQRVHAHGEWH